jgi:hypothetical protein
MQALYLKVGSAFFHLSLGAYGAGIPFFFQGMGDGFQRNVRRAVEYCSRRF